MRYSKKLSVIAATVLASLYGNGAGATTTCASLVASGTVALTSGGSCSIAGDLPNGGASEVDINSDSTATEVDFTGNSILYGNLGLGGNPVGTVTVTNVGATIGGNELGGGMHVKVGVRCEGEGECWACQLFDGNRLEWEFGYYGNWNRIKHSFYHHWRGCAF